MAKKRATAHNGHVGGKMVHNDRTFAYWKAKHIDPKKTPNNIYVSFASGERIQFNEAEKEAEFYERDERGYIVCDDSGEAVITEKGRRALFRQSMLEYYKEHYNDALEAQNEKHRARRQYKRVRKMEDVLKNKTTAPDERVIQIDNIKTPEGELISAEALQRVTERVISDMNDWSAAHGNHLHVLTYGIHVDETSPHTHIQCVWDYVDDDGNLTIAQDKALEASGIERPNPNKRDDRDNNRKMTFDAVYREWVIKAFEAEGYEVERVPLPKTDSLDIKTYSRKQYQEMTEFKAELDEREKQIIAREQRADRRLMLANNKIKEADEQAEKILQEAKEQAEKIIKQAQEQAEEQAKAINEREKELKKADRSITFVNEMLDTYSKVLDERETKGKDVSREREKLGNVRKNYDIYRKAINNPLKAVIAEDEDVQEREARRQADEDYNL